MTSPNFSKRTAQHDVPNALTRALDAARARKSRLFDLTVSNPTTAGIAYDQPQILGALANPNAIVYEPAPLGLASARSAVAVEYASQGTAIERDRIAITASTSEAYALLFKMLCDPGDEILVPAPSYPLLGWLAAFEAVTLLPYPLVYAGKWHVDVAALARAVGPRTRAIVVVNPNNPTGSYLGRDELDALLNFGLPIVSDEVFARYPFGHGVPDDRVATVLEARRGLVFALSGLSKLAGLPQLKLGWIAAAGEDARVRAAMARIETVLDAYLSVGAPVQHALPAILEAGATTREAIRARTAANLGYLRRALRAGSIATLLEVEGGWYATLRIPETRSDEQWAVLLVEEDGVYVHPGYFFDMSRGAHLVVSLLTPEPDFRHGVDLVLARIEKDA